MSRDRIGVHAYGEVDEANPAIGLARPTVPVDFAAERSGRGSVAIAVNPEQGGDYYFS